MCLWRLSRSSLAVCYLIPDNRRKKIAVDRQPTVAASVTLSGDPGSAAQQSTSATAQMVLRSNAKKDSVSECKGREILLPEPPEKSVTNNTIRIPTPHDDLTSGVPTETDSATCHMRGQSPVYRSGKKFLFLG